MPFFRHPRLYRDHLEANYPKVSTANKESRLRYDDRELHRRSLMAQVILPVPIGHELSSLMPLIPWVVIPHGPRTL
jgi:hypothetical protein